MPNLYGATGGRGAQGRTTHDSIDVPVLVDSKGRVITVPGAYASSPSGLVRPRALHDGTQVITERNGLFVTQWQELPGITYADALDAGDAMHTNIGRTTHDLYGVKLPERGIILGAKLLDRDDDTLSATMHIFNDTFTAVAFDAAYTISAADSYKWVADIVFAVTTDAGAIKTSTVTDIDEAYYAPNGFYWQFSTAGTPNLAVGAGPLVQLYILSMVGAS